MVHSVCVCVCLCKSACVCQGIVAGVWVNTVKLHLEEQPMLVGLGVHEPDVFVCLCVCTCCFLVCFLEGGGGDPFHPSPLTPTIPINSLWLWSVVGGHTPAFSSLVK